MRFVAVPVLLLTLLAAACDGDPTGAGAASRLTISTPGAFVDAGQTVQLTASATDAAGGPVHGAPVEWSSSDPAILEVRDGAATGRSVGTAYVRAAVGEARDSVLLTVEAPLAQLVVWPADTIRIIRGREATLFIEMSDEAGRPASHSLEITSSAPGTAAVRGRALAGVELGSARVTVRAGGRSREMPVEVVTGTGYTTRSLGSFVPRDLNNLGWIAGVDAGRAALWRNGEVTTLLPEVFPSSEALLVNDSGLVAGTGIPSAGAAPVLWTWRSGVRRAIPLEGYPGPVGRVVSVHAGGMNNRGEIVGWVRVQLDTLTTHSFHWTGSRVEWFPPEVYAHAINDQGVMIGSHLITGGVAREMAAPPRPKASWLWVGQDINEKGQYVTLYNPGCYEGYYWDGSAVGDIHDSAPCFYLHAINEYMDMIANYAGVNSISGGVFLVRDRQAIRVRHPDPSRGINAFALNDLGQLIVTPTNALLPGSYLVSPASGP